MVRPSERHVSLWLKACPRELFAVEQSQLQPIPCWVPAVYLLHQRIVDVEGYVAVNTNRYSVPDQFIGRQVEVRQTKEAIEVYRGPRLLATNQRVIEATGRKYRLAAHRHQRGQGRKPAPSALKKNSCWRESPKSLPTSRLSRITTGAAPPCRCVACSGWSTTIPANRCWRPSRQPPNMAFMISKESRP